MRESGARATWNAVFWPSSLGAVSGFVDAVGFLALFGVFITFQSGNSVHLGVSLGQGAWAEALQWVTPIIVFVAGVALASAFLGRRDVHSQARKQRDDDPEPDALDTTQRRRVTTVLVVEALLLCGFLVLTQSIFNLEDLQALSFGFFVLVFTLGLAAGGQTMALSDVDGLKVRTTYVSGVLTTAATSLVEMLRPRHNRFERSRHELAIVSSLWLCYVAGGTLGAYLFLRAGSWALAIPIVGLILLALRLGLGSRTILR